MEGKWKSKKDLQIKKAAQRRRDLEKNWLEEQEGSFCLSQRFKVKVKNEVGSSPFYTTGGTVGNWGPTGHGPVKTLRLVDNFSSTPDNF